MQDGTTVYQNYGKITTNIATLSLFQYMPDPGDIVVILVSQSDIQALLANDPTDGPYPSLFNLMDSIVIPISIYYQNNNVIEIGKANKDIDIISNEFNATIQTFNIEKGSDNLVSIIASTFQAIGNVVVGSNTIDELTGGAVSEAYTKLEGFLSV